MRRALMALLLLLCVPMAALAVPDTPYAPETVLQTDALSEGALAVMDLVYPAIRDCKEVILFPGKTRYEDVHAAMSCLTRNYPELFHLTGGWLVVFAQNSSEYAAALKPYYGMGAEEYEAWLGLLLETAQEMVDGTGGSQTERAEAMHDALCRRTTYDGSESGQENNSAIGALLVGTTQCEGYAGALALMYRLAGIPCGVVTGRDVDAEEGDPGHAWNVAVIDGKATLIDATWNDQNTYGVITHWYYGLTTEMMAATHVPDPDLVVPQCDSTEANWHSRRSLLARSESALRMALNQFARCGEVSIRFGDEALYYDFDGHMEEWIDEYNAACRPEEAIRGSYRVIFSDDQLCMYLWRDQEGYTP